MKPYLQAYQWCAEQKSMPVSQLRATCGGSEVLLAALERSGVGVRRFWWQYWIVRSKDVAHLAAYPATFHLAFYSIACWQTLTFKQPAARLSLWWGFGEHRQNVLTESREAQRLATGHIDKREHLSLREPMNTGVGESSEAAQRLVAYGARLV